VPPQQNAKIASKLLISLKADFRKWRELSNSGGLEQLIYRPLPINLASAAVTYFSAVMKALMNTALIFRKGAGFSGAEIPRDRVLSSVNEPYQ